MAEPGPRSVKDIEAELGPNLVALLEFSRSKNLVRIKPKKFLEKPVFADIAHRIRACGGTYSQTDHLFKVYLAVGAQKPRRKALTQIVKDLRALADDLDQWVG